MLRTTILSGLGELRSMAPAWQELLADAPSATVFQSPEWLLSVAGRSHNRLRTIAVHQGKDLVGLYPVVIRRVGWSTVRPLGVGPSDYLGPMLRADRADVAAEVWQALLDFKTDLIDLQPIRETNPLFKVAPPATAQGECLVLDLPAKWPEYVSRLNKSLRYEVRRTDKEPYLSGEARIECARTPEELLGAFERFLNLHSQRWRKRGLPGAFALPGRQALHRRWLAEAAEHERAFFLTLWHGGDPKGVLYGMRTNGRTYFYQSGFDPGASALSPGTVLVSSAIRMAIEWGDREFDFLRGNEPYKKRWMPQQSWNNVRLLVTGTNVAARIGSLVTGLGSQAEERIRQRLEGKGLLSR